MKNLTHKYLPFALLCVLCVFAVNPKGYTQNLVPNPSFETVECPTTYTGFASQISTQVSGWYSGNCASPDIMTDCSDHPQALVPDVWYGWQHAHTGTNYLAFGFYMIGSIPWYEYLGTELTQPLVAGQSYEVSFWVNRADSVRYATDEIGAYFSTTKDSCNGGFIGPVLSHTPQVKSTPGVMISDTSGWVNITGIYEAKGGEKYMLIGNYTAWDSLNLEDHGSGQARCYYYLDDVSVSGVTTVAEDFSSFFSLWPNPASESFWIERATTQERAAISIRDIQGRMIRSAVLSAGETEINIHISDLPTGLYMVEVQMGDRVLVEKIVKR